MKKNIMVAIVLALSTSQALARETTVSTGISTSIDYSDRSFEDELIPPPEGDTDSVNEDLPPPPEEADATMIMTEDRDDERSNIVISPVISVLTKSSKDAAMMSYKPSIRYDLIESETNDINHEASIGFQRDLNDLWDVKFYNVFKNTDEYETNRPMEDSMNNLFIEELTSVIPSTIDQLTDDLGSRRYSRNELTLSTGLNFQQGSRIALGYGWDHLQYDEQDDSVNYQNYDKHNVDMIISHEINSMWKVKGYGQYLRGLYEADSTTDDDLSEYHLGAVLETELIRTHPMTLSYDFSETDYDNATIDSAQIHKLNLGYQLFALPTFKVNLGAGPAYTKLSDSESSWDANGNINIQYKVKQLSMGLSTGIGTMFDNFSGTEERSLINSWETRAELSYSLTQSLETALYCGYREEDRNDLESDSEFNVEKFSAGAVLKYDINDRYNAGLNYDYTIQDSENPSENYDEHRAVLSLSYKTDLLKW